VSPWRASPTIRTLSRVTQHGMAYTFSSLRSKPSETPRPSRHDPRRIIYKRIAGENALPSSDSVIQELGLCLRNRWMRRRKTKVERYGGIGRHNGS
jgi:hypothetical protein